MSRRSFSVGDLRHKEEWDAYFLYDAATDTTRCSLCSDDKKPKKGFHRGNNKKHLMVIHREVAMTLKFVPSTSSVHHLSKSVPAAFHKQKTSFTDINSAMIKNGELRFSFCFSCYINDFF